MTPSDRKVIDQVKTKLKDLDHSIEVIEKNIVYLSALISFVALRLGVSQKEFEKLITHAAKQSGKSYEAIKFLRIMKGYQHKKK